SSSWDTRGVTTLWLKQISGGWSPLASDRYQWLEVSLGERTKVTAVATQGRYGSSDWLTSYLLMFSDTGHNWKQYRQEDSLGSFPGNSNADSVVQYKLQQPVIARFLRLIPLGWNPNGRIGLRLEAYGCPYTSDLVSLEGGGLAYRLNPEPRLAHGDAVSVKFKTVRNSGILLHAEGEGGPGLSLELHRGRLQLLLTQGTGTHATPSSEPRRLASLGSLLDDQHWHHLVMVWHNSRLNLTVDKHTEAVHIPAEFSHRKLLELNVGAIQESQKPKRGFHGCLENLLYNNLNLIELAKRRAPQVSMGNVTFSCEEPVSVAVTFPGPQSFLQLPRGTTSSTDSTTVGFQFRTWNRAGLLLTFALRQDGGVVWLYLSEARLRLQIHKAGRVLLELSAGSALSDGQWHPVELSSRRGRLTVFVDNDEAVSLPSGAGCPEGESEDCKNTFSRFQGCMRLLSIDSQPVDFMMVQQRLLGNYSHLQMDMCGITDRSDPQTLLFHYIPLESIFQTASAYERSCEAYKHAGSTSGHFYIDVDGSGPIGPQLVYCNMTEENTWMIIQHNNTALTKLRPSPGLNHLSVHFDFLTEEEQLSAAIGQSEHCEQELSYRCRKSRLLNTPEGSPFSWWVGGPGPGRLQSYWGGAQPGSQQCACGLQGDCVDPQHYCNCDANRAEWAEDSGLLTHKESLPVRSLVLGDIHRPESEAAYRVGPLRCHGDKNFWNAAFFDRETSYLHFPTFHGELSADISFLFKTTASSGVFLENLGIKDFIRIELSSSSQVLFSFDVGNGPLEVRVSSTVPLNDNRWHRVRAERNIKEASLRLDDLAPATQEAPADGHFHLQLNSQLFIGGTASRQKGFRGCIRSLQLNGVTLDLEERASITPGVRPGCPGHCSSYGSFCQNHGRCVEHEAGFHCDCGPSAYAGVFCQTEVSASFQSGTSVSYTIQEPPEFTRNSSIAPSSIHSDVSLRGENVSLSFRTFQSPAVLFYVGSFYREYLAVLVHAHGEEESGRETFIILRLLAPSTQNIRPVYGCLQFIMQGIFLPFQVDQEAVEEFNLTSDGEFRAVKSLVLGRVEEADESDPELARVASLGFTGCLSVVRFNSINPLKAALLHPDRSPVVVTGPLVRSGCGSSASSGSLGSGQPLVNAVRTDSALIGGVIAVAIFVMVAGLAIAGRFLYRRKETYRNQEVKAVKQEDSPDFPFSSRATSQNTSEENTKEYFI
uniref:Contactin-associated protein-like 4 n=1 Tax=Takifugu rubripes TaxID=31033 RepID=A0A3B5K021_TAKRU